MRRSGPAPVLACALLLAGCGGPGPPQDRGAGRFVDVAAATGIDTPTHSGGAHKRHIRETLGQGACWLDYDGDDDPDLLVLNGARAFSESEPPAAEDLQPWRLYRNDSGRFADVTAATGLALPAWGIGCAVGDANGDGFDDLYVTVAGGPHRLLINSAAADGGRRFEEARVDADAALGLAASAAFGDLDGDADLDLFVTTYLDESRPPAGECAWKGAPVMCGPKGYPMLADRVLLNDGSGTFRDATAAAGIAALTGFGLGVALLDADDDRDLDVYVANDSSPNRLLINDGRGRFSDLGFVEGIAYGENGASQAGMGVDAADLDGDGLQDLVVTNFSDDSNNFYRRHPGGGYLEWASRSGLAAASYRMLGWSVLAEDFDLDGDLDLFIANGHVYPQADAADPGSGYRQRAQLLLNDGNGRFAEHPAALGALEPANARGAAAADFDGDGDIDLVVTRDGEPPWLLRNDLPAPDAHWLGVRLAAGAPNHRGLGARVILRAAGNTQLRELRANRGYLSASEPIALFGLGTTDRVETVTVEWPGGGTTVLRAPAIDRMHVVPGHP